MIYCAKCDIKHMDKARHERFHALVDALDEHHGEEYASVARRLFREDSIDALETAAFMVGLQDRNSSVVFDEFSVEDLADAVAARYDEVDRRREELNEIRAGDRSVYYGQTTGGAA